ncbi:type II and III secretion system protein family protein [Kaustia mangrovi]|nr:type II and III secretion system protein family protein [Kaustia mangrovi]
MTVSETPVGLAGTGRHAGMRVAMVLAALAFLLTGWGDAAALEASRLPGRQALDLPVGQGRILRFDQPVESVLIADPEIADLRVVSPDVVYVYGLKPGVTNLIAITADQRLEASTQFRVVADPQPANDARRSLQPTSTVDLTIFGTRIVASGRTRSVDEAVDVDNVARTFSPEGQPPLNNTTVAGSQQVNIRVRFAEVSRNELSSFGIDWEVFVSSGSFSFGMFSTGNTGDTANLGFNVGAGDVDINVLLDVLQRNGVLSILAEPNLTAVSGQTASFLAGGEIPVPIPQDNDTIGIEYKPFGVSLVFTPTLIKNDRIALRVKPEVSSLSRAGAVEIEGFSVPSLVVRRAETTVEVASGQTFAIAGMFQRQLSRDLDKMPVLGDLPILGALFQSQRYRRDETELVIMITPYLVEPVSDRNMVTPIDRPARPPEPEPKPKPRKAYSDRPWGFVAR